MDANTSIRAGRIAAAYRLAARVDHYLATARAPISPDGREAARQILTTSQNALRDGGELWRRHELALDILEHNARAGRTPVWPGGSANTTYDDQEANYAFRAWHDWRHGYAFDLARKTLAYHAQCHDLELIYPGHDRLGVWKRILWAETVGRALHHARHGAFPANQRAFVEACLRLPPHVIPPTAY